MTIKDVAARAGVSVSTVSRVLNNRPDVSASARARVLEAVRELRFVPNNAARDLVTPQLTSIGLVVRGAENPFYTPIIHAVEEACDVAGYTMVLHQIPVDAPETEEAALAVRSKRLKGVIFLGGRFDYTEAQAESVGVPFVCCTNTNDFGDLPKDSFSSVSIDDIQVGRDATRALIEQGHRNIAIVLDSVRDRSISELRFSGYRQALEEAGITPDDDLVVQTVSFTMEASYRSVARLLERRRDFTGIFCVADTLAIAAHRAIHDAGLNVPHDVSLVAVDGLEISRYTIPALTTFCQPQEILGRRAVEILVNVLDHGAGHVHERLPTTLRRGGTLAPARAT